MDHISVNEESKAVIFLAENDEVTNNVVKNVASILDEENFLIIILKTHGEEGDPTAPAGATSLSPIRKKYKPHIQDSEHSKESDYTILKSTSGFQNSSKTVPLTLKCKYQHLVGMCKMPAFIDQKVSFLCYAGLCTVVRMMVKHVQKSKPRTKAISLLGFQETCLKAYAELSIEQILKCHLAVSNWTRFCEIELPNAVEILSATYTKNNLKSTNQSPLVVPLVLQRLEKELLTSKNLPNKYKYIGPDKQKWLLKLVKNSFEGQKLKGKEQDYVNDIAQRLDGSWSPYMIGFQITVADVIVLSLALQLLIKLATHQCLHGLQIKIPTVFKWIERMKVLPAAQILISETFSVIFSCDKDLENGGKSKHCPSWTDIRDEIEPVSQTKLEQKNSKIKVDHQNMIEQTLAALQMKGILADCPDLSDIEPKIDWNSHPLHLNPATGDLNAGRSLRKQQQIANILAAVKPLAKLGHRIVDFCAGGGHIGIVLAYFLPECEIILVENKEQSVSRAVSRIQHLGLTNIKICHSNLDYFCGSFDIGVTLHACGVATDLVLNACRRERAAFVVCPCCYGGIINIDEVCYPRSEIFQKELDLKDYMVLSHAADMTTWNEVSKQCQFGKSSMTMIDIDRCNFMKQCGYQTTLSTMVPSSCATKNHLLIGYIS